LEGKHSLRIDESGITRKDAARDAGKGGGHGVDGQLVGVGINAEVGGGGLILLDGTQAHAELAVRDQKRRRYRQRRHAEGGVIVLDLAERPVLHDAVPAGPAGDGQVVHDDPGGFANADGGDCEVRAAQAESRQADEECGQRRNQTGCDQ